LQVLREFDSRGGDRIRVKIHSPERYSDEARIAEKRFSIQAQTVGTVEAGRIRQEDIFLGFAVTSGPLEEVLPFLGRGLSVEYELTRAIKTVSQIDKKVVGILDTMVKMNGGFDIETRSRENPWAITEDLRRQYEVRAVPLDAEVPKDIDVLLVPLPSSLTDDQMYYVHQYILSGSPALLLDDPFPVTNLSFAPKIREQQKQMAQNPMAGPSSTAEPDGDIRRFLNAMGLNFEKEQIVWDTYNPHQNLPENIPPEYVFLTGSGGAQQDGPTSSTGAFNKDEPMTSGLQEMVMLFPGYLKEYSGQGGDLKITPLLTTTNLSGTQTWDKYVQRDPFFGMLSMQTPPPSSYRQSPNRFMIAARIQGTMLSAYPEGKPSEGKSKDQEKEPANEEKKEDTEKPSEPKTSEKPIDVIAIADLDFISDTFYNLRAQGVEGFNFDNVTFISNCIDTLAGDESFVNLRKRRPKHRTLTTVELRINEFDKQRAEGLENAEAVALKETREAQDNFDKKVAEVQNRQDLDSRAKTVLIQNDRKIEQIRLNLRTATIEAEKEKKVNLARLDMQKKIRAVQNSVKVRSIILPPIPALLFGIIVFVRKGRRERQGIPSSRVRR
jgi:ABC-2 type transport system permease protein